MKAVMKPKVKSLRSRINALIAISIFSAVSCAPQDQSGEPNSRTIYGISRYRVNFAKRGGIY